MERLKPSSKPTIVARVQNSEAIKLVKRNLGFYENRTVKVDSIIGFAMYRKSMKKFECLDFLRLLKKYFERRP